MCRHVFATIGLCLSFVSIVRAQCSVDYENRSTRAEFSWAAECDLRVLKGGEELFVGNYKYYLKDKIEGNLRNALMSFDNLSGWDSVFYCSPARLKESGSPCVNMRQSYIQYVLDNNDLYLFDCLYIDSCLTGLLVGSTTNSWGGPSTQLYMVILKDGYLVSSVLVSLAVYNHQEDDGEVWQVTCSRVGVRSFFLFSSDNEGSACGKFCVLDDGTVQEITD